MLNSLCWEWEASSRSKVIQLDSPIYVCAVQSTSGYQQEKYKETVTLE